MNNWDKRPHIEVYTGNILLPYITDVVTERMLSDEIKIAPVLYEVEGEQYIVTHKDEYIQDENIKIALGCLKDHMDNVHIDKWATIEGDYCMDAEDDLYTDEYHGTYHAPIIDIKIVYFMA